MGRSINIEAPQRLQAFIKLADHRRFQNTDPRRKGFGKLLIKCRPIAGAGRRGWDEALLTRDWHYVILFALALRVYVSDFILRNCIKVICD